MMTPKITLSEPIGPSLIDIADRAWKLKYEKGGEYWDWLIKCGWPQTPPFVEVDYKDWPKTKPPHYTLIKILRDHWMFMCRNKDPERWLNGSLMTEFTCYRFWYQGEVIHIQHSQEVKLNRLQSKWDKDIQGLIFTPYFMDWCWLILLEVRKAMFLSPNTHELFIYPGLGSTDIYIERGYGDTYDL